MVIKKIFISTLVAGIALMTSCSDMNGSTNLGSDIVKTSDPDKTNFSSNFSFFDTIPVNFVKSIARENDTAIGYQRIRVGLSATKRESRGMYSFLLSKAYRAKHIKDTLKSVVINTQQSSDTLKKTAVLSIYDYTNNRLSFSKPVAAADLFATMQCNYDSSTDLETYRDTLNTTGFSMIKTAHATDTSVTNTRFKVLVVTDYDSLVTLNPGAELVFTYKSAANTVILDSITSDSCNHCIIESDTLDNTLNTLAITSSETGRKSVFSLDLTALWDTLAKRTDFSTVLSTYLTIEDSVLVPSDTSDTTFSFDYYISPTLFTDANSLSDTLGSNRALSGSVKYSTSFTAKNTHTVQAAPFFRSMLAAKPDKAYLYIANANSNMIIQETFWKNPVIKDITFTNFK